MVELSSFNISNFGQVGNVCATGTSGSFTYVPYNTTTTTTRIITDTNTRGTIFGTKTVIRNIYYDKLTQFPLFDECMKKYNELRMKHSALSKFKNTDWKTKRERIVSKQIQSVIGALNIYSGKVKGFGNK